MTNQLTPWSRVLCEKLRDPLLDKKSPSDLSNSHHGLLNHPDTLRKIQRWQGFGQSGGPALIGQAGKKTPYILKPKEDLYEMFASFAFSIIVFMSLKVLDVRC
jgi:hypothetical protein